MRRAHLDASHFQVAEVSGDHLLLLAPGTGARGGCRVLVGYPVVRRPCSRSARRSRRDAYLVILSSADGTSRDVANQLAHAATLSSVAGPRWRGPFFGLRRGGGR